MGEPDGARVWIVLPRDDRDLSGWGPLSRRRYLLELDGYCTELLSGTTTVSLRLSGRKLTGDEARYQPKPIRPPEPVQVPAPAPVRPALCRVVDGDMEGDARVRRVRIRAEALGRDGIWYPVTVTAWARDRWGRWSVLVDGSPSLPGFTGAFIHNPAKLRPASRQE